MFFFFLHFFVQEQKKKKKNYNHLFKLSLTYRQTSCNYVVLVWDRERRIKKINFKKFPRKIKFTGCNRYIKKVFVFISVVIYL